MANGNGIGVDTADEVTSLEGNQFVLRTPRFRVHPHHDLATRNVQCVAQIVGSVKVAPEFSDDDILFFLE